MGDLRSGTAGDAGRGVISERPILFSGSMVRALLEGRKTQTRRLMKPQPEDHYWQRLPGYRHVVEVVETGDGSFARSMHWRGPVKGESERQCDAPQWIRNPYGQPGDRLWVRETWGLRRHFDFTDWHRGSLRGVSALPPDWELDYRADWENDESAFWRPSIHMPRWASRLTLEVESVRVERLNDISQEDAIAEGVERAGGFMSTSGSWQRYTADGPSCEGPRESFRSLWESINGPESWDANPWVWVVGFRVVNHA